MINVEIDLKVCAKNITKYIYIYIYIYYKIKKYIYIYIYISKNM